MSETYKFISFNENEFYKAIDEKNYRRISSCIINAIRNNPRFNNAQGQKRSEAGLAWDILKERTPEIFESYKVQPGEKEYNETERDSWDYEYFIRQSFLLGENFCDERYRHLREIGRAVSPKQEPQGQDQAEPSVPKTTLLLVGAVVLAILVLAVIIVKSK